VSRSRSPALAAWLRELAAGVGGQDPKRPETWILGPLWRAACYEAAAADVEHILPNAAAQFRRDARRIIEAARKGAA